MNKAKLVEIQLKDYQQNAAIILDIDGTLANINHRLHYLNSYPIDWNSFFAASKDDPVNEWCRFFVDTSLHKIIFLTGMNEDFREMRLNWLKENFELKDFELIMRPSNDREPDYIFKERILLAQILPKYNVLFAVDDKEANVQMFKKHGLHALLC